MQFLIVSGLSGAGKSKVAALLEDMGFYCVDNMPIALIPRFAELCAASSARYERVALVTDARAGTSFDELFECLELLRALNCQHKIVFVEARPDIILDRYRETRRRHPLAAEGDQIEQVIAREIELMDVLRVHADYVIDTSGFTPSDLRDHVLKLFSPGGEARPMYVTVTSFGFKYGLPQSSDIVLDVRFLPNPYHIGELRPFSGLDERVSGFVKSWPQTEAFLTKLKDLVDFLLPQYVSEGKVTLSIGIGCTGGRHRSVALAAELHEFIRGKGYNTALFHRDIARG